MRLRRWIMVGLMLLPGVFQGSERLLVHVGWLLADPALPPRSEITLVVEAGVVRSVEEGFDEL